MVQLRFLSGTRAGATWVARHFPIRVGRAATCHLQLEEHGVWNEHFQIALNPAAGFVLETQPDALVTANGQPVQRLVLHNGDILEVGAVKLQFWLGEARQSRLLMSEWLVWATILAVCFGQIALVYHLPH